MHKASPSMELEFKEKDTQCLAPHPQPLSLRFTSINSINRKIKQPENVLQFAQDSIIDIAQNSNLFDDAFTFQFDIFEFMNHTERPLLVLGVYLLSNSSIFNTLFKENKVDMLQCAHFLDLCEKLYQSNPYHNHIHATDVLQFNMILLSSSYIRHHFKDHECLAAFMAAAAHDIGHIGKNNDFLVKSKHDLATRFNNVSCLEQYHIEQFHQTIADNSTANWVKYFEEKAQHQIIEFVEYAILGTDMGVYHNEIKKELKENYTEEFVQKSYENTPLTLEQKMFITRALLHLSDISNPMRPFHIAREWAHRVNDEFFQQGDVMKDMELEISMGCDRDKTDVTKNQNGFVDYCVKPLTQSICLMISELKWGLDNMESNALKWAKFREEMNENENNEVKTSLSATSDSSSASVI